MPFNYHFHKVHSIYHDYPLKSKYSLAVYMDENASSMSEVLNGQMDRVVGDHRRQLLLKYPLSMAIV